MQTTYITSMYSCICNAFNNSGDSSFYELGMRYLVLVLFEKFTIRSTSITAELQWLEHLLNHEKFELMSVNHSARSGGIIGISFLIPLT